MAELRHQIGSRRAGRDPSYCENRTEADVLHSVGLFVLVPCPSSKENEAREAETLATLYMQAVRRPVLPVASNTGDSLGTPQGVEARA